MVITEQRRVLIRCRKREFPSKSSSISGILVAARNLEGHCSKFEASFEIPNVGRTKSTKKGEMKIRGQKRMKQAQVQMLKYAMNAICELCKKTRADRNKLAFASLIKFRCGDFLIKCRICRFEIFWLVYIILLYCIY